MPLDKDAAGEVTRHPLLYTGHWPGICVAIVVSGCAYSSRSLPAMQMFSPMIVAVVIGMIFANVVGVPERTRAGIGFCQRTVLRTAIVLLGFQITVSQFSMIGVSGMMIVAVSLGATFLFTLALGRWIGVPRELTELIAAGTSVCGASAIVAANAITRGREEDVAYAVAAVTLFGTMAMLGLPLLAPMIGLDQHAFGLWSGAAIHEVAQVVGASFQYGTLAGEVGVIAKLSRVAMLAPLLLLLGVLVRRRCHLDVTAPRVRVPWFVLGFIAAVLSNSVLPITGDGHRALATGTTFLLTVGLAALGLQSNVAKIRQYGLRPLLLALLASLFITGISLAMVCYTA